MIDGNTAALNEYERKVDRFERIESMYQMESLAILEKMEEIADQLKHLAMHYEDEYGYEFDWKEDIKNVLGVIG